MRRSQAIDNQGYPGARPPSPVPSVIGRSAHGLPAPVSVIADTGRSVREASGMLGRRWPYLGIRPRGEPGLSLTPAGAMTRALTLRQVRAARVARHVHLLPAVELLRAVVHPF